MPLTIADADPKKGTVTLVIQKVGLSSTKLCDLNVGEYVLDIVGPLGNATHAGTILGGSTTTRQRATRSYGVWRHTERYPAAQ